MKRILIATFLLISFVMLSSCACDGGCDSGFGASFSSYSASGCCATNCCSSGAW